MILALGLGLRLDYAIRAPDHPVDDARAYARISGALHRGEGFTQGEGPGYRHLQPASNYSPGLPLLTAGLYSVWGSENEEAARIVYALIGSAAVALAFFLGRRLGGPGAGLIAMVPVAVYPALLEYGGMLMTEPLATTVLAGLLLCLLRACESRRPLAWIGTGALLGALAMLRPEYSVLIPVLPALALLRLRRREGGFRRDLLLGPALALGFACLVVLPWTIRNFVVFDRLVPISTGGGQVLYEGSYIPAGPDPERIVPVLLERHPWIGRELGPQPGPIYRGQAVALLAARRHPGEEADVALRGMAIDAYGHALVHEPLRLAGFLAGKAWFAWTSPAREVMRLPYWRALQIVLLLAAAAGLLVGLLRRSFEAFLLATVFLAFTLVQMAFIASPRRTLVLTPELAALAGLGIVWSTDRLRRDSLPR
ncbi:MAG TPA: glycosyltransferase family 39 protein [Solirubrobacterales bacterium]|nr:glycosyltransferase family 39 protein [Solirubrobacterales bacterium]